MTRDPLLPVRLVDGVWTTEGAGSVAAVPTDGHPGIIALGRGAEWPCSVTLPPRPATDYARAFAEYNPAHVEEEHRPLPFVEALLGYTPATGETVVSFDADVTSPGEKPIPVCAVVTWTPSRRIFAAVAIDGSGVWAIGDTEKEARAGALDRREYLRDCARSVDDDFPPPETDAAWLDTLALVTLSGTTESLRAIVAAIDDVIPWCPLDLWDYAEPTKEL